MPNPQQTRQHQGNSAHERATQRRTMVLGVLTVLVPLCVMQPAMGAGLAPRKTPTPWRNSLRSLASHTVFGLGLYLATVAVAWWCPVA